MILIWSSTWQFWTQIMFVLVTYVCNLKLVACLLKIVMSSAPLLYNIVNYGLPFLGVQIVYSYLWVQICKYYAYYELSVSRCLLKCYNWLSREVKIFLQEVKFSDRKLSKWTHACTAKWYSWKIMKKFWRSIKEQLQLVENLSKFCLGVMVTIVGGAYIHT